MARALAHPRLPQAIDSHRNKRNPLSLFTRLCMARDIICGMVFVHEHSLVHHDLKPANVMLNEHGRAVIVDFGFSRKKAKEPQKDSARGSLLWMAPEVMNHQPYAHPADVYSWSIIAWQLLTGAHEPYEQYRDPQVCLLLLGCSLIRFAFLSFPTTSQSHPFPPPSPPPPPPLPAHLHRPSSRMLAARVCDRPFHPMRRHSLRSCYRTHGSTTQPSDRPFANCWTV